MSDPMSSSPLGTPSTPPPRFRLRASRVAAQAGARRLGATLYEIEPGGRISPVHVHYANEELLVVLAGRPQLLTPDNLRSLDPGAVVAFRTGSEGAHAVGYACDVTVSPRACCWSPRCAIPTSPSTSAPARSSRLPARAKPAHSRPGPKCRSWKR